MQNTKDDIGFHNLLFSVRKNRGVSLERLGYGLYSSSMIHYIESGERLPDYLMRNRIMDRLGIAAEDYSDYVSGEEYDRYLKRNELIKAIESEQTDTARTIYEFLMDRCEKAKKIEYQFLLDMKAKILMQEQRPINEIAEIYKQAVNVTMLGIELKSLDDYYLAADEYYLLILWIRTAFLAGNLSFNEVEGILISILKTVEKSFFQEITKSRIFPMAVVTLYTVYKSEGMLSNIIIISRIIHYTDAAIELLKRSSRLYYIIELLEIKESLKCIDKKSKMWLEVLKELYDEYGVCRNADYACYIYKNISIISAGNIIKSRREMLGVTKKELSEGVCAAKTLERLEKGQNNPQQVVLKGLMEKLGVNGDYCRTDIHTNNYDLIQTYNECLCALNRNNNDVDMLLDIIRTNIDNNGPNQQELIRIINVKELREGKISTERFVANMKKALMCTGIDIDKIQKLSGYLTNSELQCIYNIANRGGNTKDVKRIASLLIANCEYINKENKPIVQYPLYELIMSWYANKLGNEGEYQKSCIISERLIVDSLQRQRSATIAKELYNIAWNTVMQEDNNINFLRKLEKIESLYEYGYRSDKALFVHNKIEKIKQDC